MLIVAPLGMYRSDVIAPVGGTTHVRETPDGICRRDSLIVAVGSGGLPRSLRPEAV